MSRPDLSTYGGRLLDEGYAGQVIDLNTHSIFNYRNEGAAGIDFGLFVARGAAADTCKLPGAADDEIVGISVRHSVGVADINGDVLYLQNAMVPALEIGRIRVVCENGCSPGDPVFVRYAGAGVQGAARSATVANETAAFTAAVWDSTTAAGGLGVIRILK
ncbi:structural cement protein Gp24 [Luteibacter sp. NPDC031894]|uniref:structural cement protein Gp24 n=1 Tax=Luteibacter sp. NPDC031894 TaxID=3390572 RepID=UPI003D01F583